MNGVGRQGADAEHRLKSIGPGPQMGDRPQIFQRMAFFLQGIIRGGRSFHLHGLRLDLKRLPGLRGGHQPSPDNNRGSHVQPGNFLKIFHMIPIDCLQRLKAASVLHRQKAEIPGAPVAPHPASDLYVPVQKRFRIFVYFLYCMKFFHAVSSCRDGGAIFAAPTSFIIYFSPGSAIRFPPKSAAFTPLHKIFFLHLSKVLQFSLHFLPKRSGTPPPAPPAKPLFHRQKSVLHP